MQDRVQHAPLSSGDDEQAHGWFYRADRSGGVAEALNGAFDALAVAHGWFLLGLKMLTTGGRQCRNR